jgi:hypothetical protein
MAYGHAAFEFTAKCADPALICWLEAHPGTAAWLQAVLTPVSVALALAAILVPGWLAKQQRKVERREVLRSAATAAAVGAGAVRLVHAAAEIARNDPTNFRVPRSLIESHARTVREFPLHALTDEEAAHAMHLIRLLVDSALDDAGELEELVETGGIPDRLVMMFDERAKDAEGAWRALAKLAGATEEQLNLEAASA